ncbi:type II toxin-antitoxin system Phd/YefM family antitoxin (plasmid) [Synechocystis sp. PCC 7339]|uniref:type II toxin-antitoxin system Phd/YefM family antitoxin n=1 Tax=unclassified Synechocystis TaxID=2640012 RepID=UPI001BB0C202|nr:MULTISPECIES: type II toxin-antitoxin system Phd/YefM family antitoxin [unclassified Synechocystis]QUS62547.1 type II toxin-antitoxin system Phd/YefM family antitoxin [Synechocystis sp. PCC 7338]UAJ74639.1 type II toxin-antitoxin system Phd/YefM family antitoxin [Synechocystis sp. PCC 7339]
MRNANIHEAKTHLSQLIKSVLAGEDVIISRAGKPLVRLIPYEGPSEPRQPGAWEGQIIMADDFDEESPEINALFYGDEI